MRRNPQRRPKQLRRRRRPDRTTPICTARSTIRRSKTSRGLFRDPVTDDLVPGYSVIVKNPMDFTTMRKRFTERQYLSWEQLLEDMMLMFDNSMLYNPPDTIYYKQSKTLKEVRLDR